MKAKNNDEDVNSLGAPIEDFVQYYNQNIPETFPRASIKALREFKAGHSSLFGKNEEWTIDKHRKRLMDWLTSYTE